MAQALAVLGDGCELRHAAGLAGVEVSEAISRGAGLVRLEVLGADDPPRFVHPIVRDSVEGSRASDARDVLHRAAAGVLHADRAPSGQVAAHLVRVRPTGDGWVLARLREAARTAMGSGAPGVGRGRREHGAEYQQRGIQDQHPTLGKMLGQQHTRPSPRHSPRWPCPR